MVLCSVEQTICAILVEGIIRKNSEEILCIWTRGSEGDVF